MSLQFVQPESISEALAALAKYGDEAKVIAGGSAVVLMLQQRLIVPEVLISLGRVPDLDYIRAGEDGLPRPLGCSLGTPAGQAYAGTMHLGPLALLRQVEHSPLVQEQYPALARACGEWAMYAFATRRPWGATWPRRTTPRTHQRCYWPWMTR
ncbi:MAG: FAD binding domain-containing protein [Anaerolineae bacterium]